MSFTVFTNVITVLFCIAVLIQSVRMMRSLKQVREGQLDRTVGALDTATAKAQAVLSELKQTLSIEGTANARALGDAREVREELNVMIGIANAMAERLIEAASSVSRQEAAAAVTSAKPSKAIRPPRARGTKPAQPKADATKAKPADAKVPGAKAPNTKGPRGKSSDAKPTGVKAVAKTEPERKIAAAKTAPVGASRKRPAQGAGIKEPA